ncbi:MAG: NAD(P)/FAD-dependent oxidoreductase [Bacteroidales bacterium]
MNIHMRPYWISRLADTRKPRFPAHRGELDAEVAIVGGGLLGCTTALVFASAGVRTALVEAKRIGEHASAAAPGVILPEPSLLLTALHAASGRRSARIAWDLHRRAARDFAALLRRANIRCDQAPADVVHYLSDRDSARELERERDLRGAMDIDGSWMTPLRASQQLHTGVAGALRVRGAMLFDPYRACLGLARTAARQRARIFERSPVVRIRQGDGGVEVETPRGTLRAARVIVATGGPGRLFQPLGRRFNSLVTYRVVTQPLAARQRRQLPAESMVLSEASCPGHLLRWTRDHRLLFGGIERPRLPERSRPNALVQHSNQLMYELSLLYPGLSGIQPDYAWDALISASDDGLPYIGPHRHYPRHLFALGAGRSDGGTALLAAQVLLRCHTDRAEKHDALFGFGR